MRVVLFAGGAGVLAAADREQAVWGAATWTGVLLVILLAAAVVIVAVRRWAVGGGGDRTGGLGLSFDQIRRLREEGTLSREEYEALRRSMLGAGMARSAAGTDDPRSSNGLQQARKS